MTFKDNLFVMLSDLQQHKNKKELLDEKYIQERLDKTVQAYYDNLLKSYDNVSTKKDITILRNIAKED